MDNNASDVLAQALGTFMEEAGDLLAQIDPRPYQVSLENAEGTQIRKSVV